MKPLNPAATEWHTARAEQAVYQPGYRAMVFNVARSSSTEPVLVWCAEGYESRHKALRAARKEAEKRDLDAGNRFK